MGSPVCTGRESAYDTLLFSFGGNVLYSICLPSQSLLFLIGIRSITSAFTGPYHCQTVGSECLYRENVRG